MVVQSQQLHGGLWSMYALVGLLMYTHISAQYANQTLNLQSAQYLREQVQIHRDCY